MGDEELLKRSHAQKAGGGGEARKTENAMVVRSYETSGKIGRRMVNNNKDRMSWTLLTGKLLREK